MIFLRFEFIQGCGSFAEALAAIIKSNILIVVPRATKNNYWRLNASRNLCS